jgi:hypothetical protein
METRHIRFRYAERGNFLESVASGHADGHCISFPCLHRCAMFRRCVHQIYDLEGLGIRPQHCKKRLAVCQSSPFAYLPPPIKSLRNETSGFFRYRGRFLGQ